MTPTNTKKELKNVKHVFSRDEKEKISQDLVGELAKQSGLEAEAKQVKSSYTAKLDEASARIGAYTQQLQSGFEMRLMECRVEYRPKDKKKDFFRTDSGELVVTEDMTQEDFQINLLIEDAAFEAREEIELWKAGSDSGKIVVGKAGARWTAAIRAKIGTNTLAERMTKESKSFKNRADALTAAVDRMLGWCESVSPGSRAGFEQKAKSIIEQQKERVE